jgi:hypothetical protein
MTEVSPHLHRNLIALGSLRPELVQRIGGAIATQHIRLHEDGSAHILRHKQWHPLALPAEACAAAFSSEDLPRLLICGAGLGELVDAALTRYPDAEIRVWDRDPYLLRLCLSRYDFSDAILSGQLQLLLGPDLVDALDDPGQVVAHPTLLNDYSHEHKLLHGHGLPRKGWVLLCKGELFVDDLNDALEREGYACFRWDIERLIPAELETYVAKLKPALVATINYRNKLSEACAELGLPLLCWEIDPTIDKLLPCAEPQPHSSIFTWRRAHLAQYTAAGFPKVHFTPLAASTHRRRPLVLSPEERAHYQADVCFVGASCMQQVPRFKAMLNDDLQAYFRLLDHADIPPASEVLETFLARQRQEFSRFLLPELFQEHLQGFKPYLQAQGKHYEPAIVLGELAAAEKRLNYVANLAPFQVQVWGDPGWKTLTPHGVHYRGSAGHLRELTRIYNAAAIHVDIGRIYQPDIVTMRVFDVLACGGFLLAEYSEGLESLFELGEELICYQGLEELKQLVVYYLAHPEEARAIAARGKARVERDHTIQQRLQTMLKTMGLATAARRPVLVG